MGATDTIGRLASSLGRMGPAVLRFTPCIDIPNAGVLLALPALLANGLLRHTDKLFQLPKGFYGLYTIFLLTAFMLLSRIKSVEGLRYRAPGEWGKFRHPDLAGVASELRKRPICSARLLGNSAWNIASSPITASWSLFQFPAYASRSGCLKLCPCPIHSRV